MPELPSKQQKPPIQGQKPQIPDKQMSQEPKKPTPPENKPKSAPKPEKDDSLKYEMTYVNGGFNNGVEIKPGRGGKIELSIAIYGGGEKKTLGISPLPPSITKLTQAYEIGADRDTDVPEITDELKRYFDELNQALSMKVIDILREADEKVKKAIKETFSSVNQGF